MSQQFIHEPTVDELLTFVYSCKEEDELRNAAYQLMLYVEKSLKIESGVKCDKNTSKLGFSFIDELLEKLDVTKASPLCLVAAIRCTFRVKNRITNWYALLERIKGEMIRRNMDYKRHLRGLI